MDFVIEWAKGMRSTFGKILGSQNPDFKPTPLSVEGTRAVEMVDSLKLMDGTRELECGEVPKYF